MVVDGALRAARRSRRVVDRDRLVLVFENAQHRIRRASSEERLVRIIWLSGVVNTDRPLDAGAASQLLEFAINEHEARACVLKNELDVIGVEPIIDGHEHAAAAVLLNSSPFFVALIARFALDESITRLRAAGLVIGFGGVLLVVFSDPGNIAHGSQLAIGFALALLGAIGWAGGSG